MSKPIVFFCCVSLLLFCLLLLLVGCEKKYPDDNLPFHTRSACKRLTKSAWEITSHRPLYSTSFYPDCGSGDVMECEFKIDGTSSGGCAFIHQPGALTNMFSYNYYFKGTWEFINNDSDLKVTHDASHFTIWAIKQLDRKEMKIVSDSIELTLER